MSVLVYQNSGDVASAAAEMIVAELAADGLHAVGLAGGTTPRATYQLLERERIDWTRVTLWLGDERWVPSDHPDSNARMVRDALGKHASARVEAPDHGAGDPDAAALEYQERLTGILAAARPGLVLLGMGDDGHTASLFPGSDALDVTDRDYVANWIPAVDAWRLTATRRLLAGARRTVFLVTGEAKAQVLAEIIDDGASYPAGRVAAEASDVLWMLDGAAAAKLKTIPR